MIDKLKKIHSTNYYCTFIEVATDCPVTISEIPLGKGKPTVASLQYVLIKNHPYKFTSDEVLFKVFAIRNNIPNDELEPAKTLFFSKGQPCLRSSPLPKRYGWGVHCNHEGRIAIFSCESEEYSKLQTDKKLRVIKAMRSARTK
ncbi:MAG: hypothetical protein EA393_16370 [Bacteroidetes bacterium]|nr:MAG: hypothetical protein EA393_16370 [Bacteroidota bacterium]